MPGKNYDEPQNDPSYGARVRMRVKVKVVGTSLPLAHDAKWAPGGNNRVKQGEHKIVVFKADVDKVMAKVEDDVMALRAAHETFWNNAVSAVRQSLAGGPYANMPMPIPDIGDTMGPNRWVDTKWQPPDTLPGQQNAAVLAYNLWLQNVYETSGSPQTVFRVMKGRTPRPLEYAEVIPGPDLPAPFSDEQKAADAIAQAAVAMGAGASPASVDVAAIAAAASKAAVEAMIAGGWSPPKSATK